MIIGVFGKPRSGKTTTGAYFGLRALARKPLTVGHGVWKVSIGDFSPYDYVYSTFPLYNPFTGKKIKGKNFYQISFDDLGKIEVKPNSLILCDEISLVCDSRDYKNYAKHTKEFMALHGHYKVDFVYFSQSWDDTDKKIRNMTEVLLCIDRFGGFTRIRPIKVDWSIDGKIETGYHLAPPLSSQWYRRKKYYKMFDSFDAPALPSVPLVAWDAPSVPVRVSRFRSFFCRLFCPLRGLVCRVSDRLGALFAGTK